MANGFGEYTHINGSKYRGEFRDDIQEGHGEEDGLPLFADLLLLLLVRWPLTVEHSLLYLTRTSHMKIKSSSQLHARERSLALPKSLFPLLSAQSQCTPSHATRPAQPRAAGGENGRRLAHRAQLARIAGEGASGKVSKIVIGRRADGGSGLVANTCGRSFTGDRRCTMGDERFAIDDARRAMGDGA